MKNLVKLFFVFMLVTSCTEDDALMETKNTNTNYKTAETQKVSALLEDTQKSSSWFTPHLSYSESIALNHTNAEIIAYPVTSVLNNAYSRLFSLEVDGETKLSIYHMIPSEESTSEHFYGKVIVSDLDGKVFRGFKVEANEFISMYDFESLKPDYYVIDFLESEGKCDEDECPFSSCNLCGELDEVIIPIPPDSEPDVPVVLPPGDGGGGGPPSGDPLPNLPGGGGGGANDGSCPPGEIKDELGNCVEPPEDGGVYIIGECPEEDDDGLSMAGVCLELKCTDGYYENFEGDCILKESCATNDEIINSQSIQSAFENLWESSGALSPDIPMESRLEDGGWIIQNGGSYEFVPFDSSWTRTPCGIDPPANWASTIPSNLIGVVHTHPFYLGEDRRSICDGAEEEYIGGPSEDDYFFLTQVMNEVNDFNLLGYVVDGDLITSFDSKRTINLQNYQRCGY